MPNYNAFDELQSLIQKAKDHRRDFGSNLISTQIVEQHMKDFKDKIKSENPSEEALLILSRLSANQEFMIAELIDKMLRIQDVITKEIES